MDQLAESIEAINGAADLESLNNRLQQIVRSYGFESYCFVDAGAAHSLDPYYTGTTEQSWTDEYASNGFVEYDPALHQSRHTNLPFSWGSLVLPKRRGKRVPKAHQVMHAAQDHGHTEGFVLPFHTKDSLGRYHSAVCTLFWGDNAGTFKKQIELNRASLHMIFLYWAQRSLELREVMDSPENVIKLQHMRDPIALTDREQDVLSWAARGKTAAETAEILGLSLQTVKNHISHATHRLEATNKTHAVSRSLLLGLIDP